jgi:hypothetical protein
MRSRQRAVVMKCGEQGSIEGRLTVGVLAVKQKLTEHDTCQEIVDRVVCKPLTLETFPNAGELLQEDPVCAAVAAKAVRKPPVKVARGKPHPVQGVGSLLGRGQPSLQIKLGIANLGCCA